MLGPGGSSAAPKERRGRELRRVSAVLRDLAADAVEEHVDAIRTGFFERDPELSGPVVDSGVITELVDQPRAITARQSYGSAALDLRDLSDDRSHSTRRRRHEHGLTLLGLPDIEQTKVRRQPCSTEHAQHRGEGNPFDGPDLAVKAPRGDAVRLPSSQRLHDLPHGPPLCTRLDDLRQRPTPSRLPNPNGRQIRFRVAHPPATPGRSTDTSSEATPRRSVARRRPLGVLQNPRRWAPRQAAFSTQSAD